LHCFFEAGEGRWRGRHLDEVSWLRWNPGAKMMYLVLTGEYLVPEESHFYGNF
jgi:hypothetical protein